MTRLLITNVAICATALLAVYCTTFEFNNPFDPDNKHTLTVNSNLTAGGTVSPAGMSTRSGGERVVVTAAAAAGYVFTGWSGAVLSTASSVTIIMDGNKTLTAHFLQITYTLTVDNNPETGGTVTVNGSTYMDPTTHYSGASVTVRAVPSSSYTFTGWEGASTSTDSEISVTMSDNWMLTANFAAVLNTPSVDDFDISGIGAFTRDGIVKAVTVTAKEGKTTGAITVRYDGNTAAPSAVGTYAVTFDVAAATGWNAVDGLPAGVLVITVEPIYTLTVACEPAVGGTVTVNGSAYTNPTTHNYGASVTVRATPNFGYRFAGWSGASTSTNSEIAVTMNDNQTLTANFSQITYTLTVDSNPAVGGSVTVNGSTYTNPTTHNSDASVTVRAVPSSGYRFTGWSGASTSTSSEIAVTMSDNRTLTANFKLACVSSFTDSRDGQTYCTVVTPDGKAWMSENLNRETANSWCYDNNASNCNTYGRLYTWDAAMVACPVDWRLPTRDDWGALSIAAGGTGTYGAGGTAGAALKVQLPAWNGTNTHGFSALPGGYRWGEGAFFNVNYYGYWWTATEHGSNDAYNRGMYSDYSGVYEDWGSKSHGLSVRCVRDNISQITYTLTVSRNPVAGGTVTVNGSTTTGTTTHNSGASVTVRAVPSSGYVFTGWSGASTSTNSEISVTMNDNRTLTANFSQITYTLTVSRNPVAGGTVTVNGSTTTGTTTHNSGVSVTVRAVPSSGYVFTGWSGASTSTSSEISITMSDSRTLTANFQLQPTCSFTNPRDGQPYRTVVIGYHEWMAENLNCETANSWCYDNNVSNCNTYGRLYTWDAATVACPVGWRLPTQQDWRDLVRAVDNNAYLIDGWDYGNVAGTALKAQPPAWDGTNTHGFSALPGGGRGTDGDFWDVGSYGFWWSATEGGSDYAYYWGMNSGNANVWEYWDYKCVGFSVRCLRDNFSQITYTLTVNRNTVAGGTVTVNGSTTTGTTTHNSGASVTVRATPSSGYVFTGWSGASTSTSSEISITMSDNRTLTANFQLATGSAFTDSRDGHTYGTVVMPDGKTWMSENLNYETANSWCYGNNASNCNTYGRLYTWDAAREACPVGWRLPTNQEWTALVNAIGGNVAGTALKAQSPAWDGTNTHGFSALPGGGRDTDGYFWDVGSFGYWWSATEDGSGIAYRRYMGSGNAVVWENWYFKSCGFSVRCLRD